LVETLYDKHILMILCVRVKKTVLTGTFACRLPARQIVYEKDLGRQTAEIAKTLTRQDRDASWRKAK